MVNSKMTDYLNALLGSAQQHGNVYTWTSKQADPRYEIKQITISADPDGPILINAITGELFDLKAFLAKIQGDDNAHTL